MPSLVTQNLKFDCMLYSPRWFSAKMKVGNMLLPGNCIDIGGCQYKIQELTTGHQIGLILTSKETREDFVFAQLYAVQDLCTIVLLAADLSHVKEFQEVLSKLLQD